MDTTEWKREYLGRWCGAAAEREGHLLPCSLGYGHEGECIPTARTIARHRLAGQKACLEHGCGRTP